MEDELHKMLRDALGQEAAKPIWQAFERRIAEQRAMYEGAHINGLASEPGPPLAAREGKEEK